MITITPEDIAERHSLSSIEPITSGSVRCNSCRSRAEFEITYVPCGCGDITLNLCAQHADDTDTWADARSDTRCHEPAACGYDR